MVHDWKMELYWRLPIRLQEMALSSYSRHLEKAFYGSVYEEWIQWLIRSKNWSRSRIKEWENQQLQYILELASKHVPYYRNKWKDIDWKNVRSERDLYLLPTLDKQLTRQNEQSFIVENKNPKSLWCYKTSGTTGTSLRTYCTIPMVQKDQALTEVMIRYEAGVSNHMPRCMVGGRPIIRGNTNKPPYWRFNRRWSQLYFSSYHISKKTVIEYINALKKYKSTWIVGYGSAIAALAESALQAGVEPYAVRSVVVSGDTLSKGMRLSIETFFQCKCYDFYGQSEGITMAMECNHGRIHVVPIVGIMEILREDGTPCEPGEEGEIVATTLLNDAMPLIRYRTGDCAAWAKEQECQCGNPNPVITSLEGRVDDYLLTSDGRKIGRLSTAMKRSPSIHSAQIVQDKPGHAFLLVRPGERYQRSHAEAVCDDIRERIGKFELDTLEVAEIPKTLQGKTVLVLRLENRPEMRPIYDKVLKKSIARQSLKRT